MSAAPSAALLEQTIPLPPWSPEPTGSLDRVLAADRAEVDRVLRGALDSDVALIRQVAEYIIGSGGKRLRPALVVMAARACGYAGRDALHRSPRSSR